MSKNNLTKSPRLFYDAKYSCEFFRVFVWVGGRQGVETSSFFSEKPDICAEILERFMGARNRVGIGLSRPFRPLR